MANPFLLVNIQRLLSFNKINFQDNFFLPCFPPSCSDSTVLLPFIKHGLQPDKLLFLLRKGLSLYVTTIVGRVYWFMFPSLAPKVAAATRTRTAHVCCRCRCCFCRHHNLQSIRKALEGSGLLLTNLSAQSESNSIIKCDRFQNYRVAFCVMSRIITLIFNA